MSPGESVFTHTFGGIRTTESCCFCDRRVVSRGT